jgi:hypothetical protein
MTIEEMREAVRKKDFLLLREGRSVIKDAPLHEHLLRQPVLIWPCRVIELFFRKAGTRP